MNLLERVLTVLNIGPRGGITRIQAIDAAREIFKTHGHQCNCIGVAWRTRNFFVIGTDVSRRGGDWYVKVDRRSGETAAPFVIPY